jgi:DNA-directed RNA polymerase subunit RPC12/RpoP
MSRTKAEIEVLEELGRLRRKERPLEITEIHLDEYYCPACGSENGCDDRIVTDNYCPECGQRIFQKMEAKGLEPLASR